MDQILTRCKTSVQGRVEYFGRYLLAADCMCHHSLDVNVRTKRDVPMQHSTEPSANKRTKVGRPTNVYQQEGFLMMCAHFEDNDQEQLSLTDLANKMKEYLQDDDYVDYAINI